MSPALRLAAAPIVALVLAACTVNASPAPPVAVAAESTGTAVVDWTIRDGKDSSDCSVADAASIQIHVMTTSGADAGTFAQNCDVFATSIELAPGDYVASAELVDGGGTARTTSVQITSFSIFGGDSVTLPIDFPASSFF